MVGNEKVEALPEEFDPKEIQGSIVVRSNGVEMVLGRNVHTMCLSIQEPEPNDEITGEREAYMASVLARYRKSLVERTQHHLGMRILFLCNFCSIVFFRFMP